MRSLKQLYLLVHREIANSKNLNSGICAHISELFKRGEITQEEYSCIMRSFQSNKPKWYKHSSFWFNKLFRNAPYWWPPNQQGRWQRILFIERLIKKYS